MLLVLLYQSEFTYDQLLSEMVEQLGTCVRQRQNMRRDVRRPLNVRFTDDH